MNFLKSFFMLLFTHRVLSVLVTLVFVFILYYMMRDVSSVETLFEGAYKWVNDNMQDFINWILEMIAMIKSKFVQ